ncbi:MAG: Maf family protein [Clostridia bacterium]|nr:Maf family protein [Clostridia bacterium]
MPDLILASASPRRRDLLQQLGLEFSIQVSNVDETVDVSLAPGLLVESLARQKAEHVAGMVKTGIVIGADTVVVQDDSILGKPAGPEEAAAMLRRLSGTSHRVITGVALIDAATGRERVEHEVTTVRFRELQNREIANYIASGEPADKAGAYAIQGLGSVFVLGIEGCYFNVVGLPVARLAGMLKDFGITVL